MGDAILLSKNRSEIYLSSGSFEGCGAIRLDYFIFSVGEQSVYIFLQKLASMLPDAFVVFFFFFELFFWSGLCTGGIFFESVRATYSAPLSRPFPLLAKK